ncbi:hypothetical protein [Actinokineospora sp. UTMC 2448]|uniref:hypothetical protein n=1 Tax=Actinokineospora sp. UTMC 2448 TaxID=2268449 RepID=UPI0021640244|nr:hypothetical protein [Actinokineospora sp. UTMC 2448]UVS81839.1 hypothetical protein Actkin_05603 [Actinokineospora sp. UTMC 2448]
MPVEQGPVEVHRHDDGRVEIVSAPPWTLISLELLAAADPVVFQVAGRRISLAGQVTYEVTGWDETQACLVARRIGEQ